MKSLLDLIPEDKNPFTWQLNVTLLNSGTQWSTLYQKDKTILQLKITCVTEPEPEH